GRAPAARGGLSAAGRAGCRRRRRAAYHATARRRRGDGPRRRGVPRRGAGGGRSITRHGERMMFGAVHHVGVTVADMDRAVAFWERLLGTMSRDRRVMHGPQLGTLVGYP